MSRAIDSTRRLPPASLPPVGLGLAAASIALVGMMLFWLPILGVPISGAALIIALSGMATAVVFGAGSVRWSARAVVLSGLALSINLMSYFAPVGFRPAPEATPRTAPVPAQMDVPPPAPP